MSLIEPESVREDFWNYGSRIYPPRAVVEQYLGQLAPLFSPNRTVVDLGCGRGEFMNVLREHGHTAIGVDISLESREAVTGMGFAYHQVDVLEFCNSWDVPHDGLFSYGLLEHFDAVAIRKLFDGLGRRSEAGTEAVFATHNPASIQALTRPLFAELTHERLYSPELISFLFESNGFEVRRVGPLAQESTLISDKALAPEENARFVDQLRKIRERGERRAGDRETEYLAQRVDVIERVLDQIVDVINVPMDYFVFAVKK